MYWIDDETNLLSSLFANREMKYPAECPVCKKKSAHIFFYRHDENISGYWCWCSSCRRFEHSSGRTPSWWTNADLNPDLMESEPEYLENNKDKIDRWINILNGYDHFEDYAVIKIRRTMTIRGDVIEAGTEGTILESHCINGKYSYMVELPDQYEIIPVVDLRADDIEYDFEINSKYLAVQIAEQYLFFAHKPKELIQEYMDEEYYFLSHAFFGDEFTEPLFSLLEEDASELEIVKYINIILQMYRMDNSYIMNVLDVTVFERLSDSEKVWNKLATFLPNDVIKYINEDLIPGNGMMTQVGQMKLNPESDIVNELLSYQDSTANQDIIDMKTASTWVLSWLELQYKRYLHTLEGKHDMRKPLELSDYPWCHCLRKFMLKKNEFSDLFKIDGNLFDFKDDVAADVKLFIEREAFLKNEHFVCL